MSTTISYNGLNYTIPATGDSDWGPSLSAYLIALATGSLNKSGGTFTLTSDVNLGANFGIVSKYFTSGSTSPASTGQVRLSNTDSVSFRNSSNTGDIALKPDADGFLQYNSIDLANISGAQTLTNKTISGSANTLSNIADGSLTESYLKADGSRALTGNWAAGAFSITANSVVVGSAANTISALSTIINTGTLTLPTTDDTLVGRATTDTLTNKTLTSPVIATIVNTGTLTLPTASDTLVGRATTDTLTNKTISGASNTLSNIGDAALSASYLKADGSRALSSSWAAGAFSITANSVVVGAAANEISGLATIINGTGTLTLPTTTDTLVGRATTDTLTNKTISGSSNTLSSIGDSSLSTSYLKADGSRALTGNWAAGAFSITANSVVVGSAANTVSGLATIINTGTLTLPTATDTLVGRATTDTLTNKTLVAGSTNVVDGTDASKKINFSASGATTSTTTTLASVATSSRTLTLPNSTDTLAGIAASQTLTNKTIGDALIMSQVSSPVSSPTSTTKFYAKSDGRLYYFPSGGAETLVGAGAGGIIYAADTGTANAYVITPTNAATGYVAGDTYAFLAANDNTGASTLNVSSLGAKNILGVAGSAILPSAIRSGQIVIVTYDGTEFLLESESYVQPQNGRPGKNYVRYADFETLGTTGWSLGTVGTLTNGLPTGTPTFGSGASVNLSITNTASSPIAGNRSLLLASSAATTQGNMLATDSLAIDAGDQTKVLSVRFYYRAASNPTNANWSGTSSNSFAWAVWDVTNSVWLSSAGNFNLVQSSGVGICTGTVQTNATTANIRLVVYSANATSGAISVGLDDFYVGPQTQSMGPAMSDWVAYTPTITGVTTNPTLGTNTQAGYYRRVGDSLEIRYDLHQSTAGTAGSGHYLFSLPSGLTIDTSKLKATAGADGGLSNVVGTASVFSTAGSSVGGVGYSVAYDSTHLALLFYNSGVASNAQVWGADSVNNNLSNTTVWYSFTALVPIVGWSSNTVQSSDTDTRVTAFSVNTSTTAASTTTPFVYTATDSDTNGGYNASNGRYTVQVSGKWTFGATMFTGATATFVSIYKNGTLISQGTQTIANTAAANVTYTGTFVAGDIVDIRPGASATASSGGVVNNFWGYRLSGPAVVQATESVNAQVRLATSGAFNSTTIKFDTVIRDTHAAYSTSTGKYTVPVSGTYRVGTTLNGNATYTPFVKKNSTAYASIGTVTSTTVVNGSVEVYCNAGDTLEIDTNATVTITGDAGTPSQAFAYFSRVGN